MYRTSICSHLSQAAALRAAFQRMMAGSINPIVKATWTAKAARRDTQFQNKRRRRSNQSIRKSRPRMPKTQRLINENITKNKIKISLKNKINFLL